MSTTPAGGPRHDPAPEHANPDLGRAPARSGPDQSTDTIPTRPRGPARSRGDLLQRQQDRFGGIKWGAAFFGWLTAIGTAVLLSALVTAVGALIGVALTGGTDLMAEQAAQDTDLAQPAAIVSAIVAAVILLLAYYCGGYVAGRMARFNGVKQGIAVWLWTIITTTAVVILAAIAGDQFDVLSRVDGLPQLPVGDDTVVLTAILTVAAALAITLIGAILGGLAGMRFHRKVDHADLGRPDGNRTDGDRPDGDRANVNPAKR
ncbi:hypothetical protein ACFPM7_15755 [Actinokineospora guangxiensis]|uniref:Major facilitator superfamily (MFS) profile domain-containing protein n=1 Tax=Actinokineospora guangxiensis TaxID=1490288 RepID=A0ABW0ERI6_9PSEU